MNILPKQYASGHLEVGGSAYTRYFPQFLIEMLYLVSHVLEFDFTEQPVPIDHSFSFLGIDPVI